MNSNQILTVIRAQAASVSFFNVQNTPEWNKQDTNLWKALCDKYGFKYTEVADYLIQTIDHRSLIQSWLENVGSVAAPAGQQRMSPDPAMFVPNRKNIDVLIDKDGNETVVGETTFTPKESKDIEKQLAEVLLPNGTAPTPSEPVKSEPTTPSSDKKSVKTRQ